MIPAFITVRTESTRLPNKCLLPFGSGNVLQHIINRCKFYSLEPIVCTSLNKSDDVLEEIAHMEKAKLFRGDEVDKLRRWRGCCEYFSLDSFHSVDADDPFFDPIEIEKSYRLLLDGYDVVCPTESSSKGGASSGYSLTKSIISKACDLTLEGTDTEMMWYYLDKVPKLKKIVLPESNDSNNCKVRLTLDYEEDYWLLDSVRRIVGNNATRDEVDILFINNPDLYRINWFRNDEWKAGQEFKKPM
jgi:spore coat polysaccharide biosynthesis protein SpsF (cytidylyltransferase family)